MDDEDVMVTRRAMQVLGIPHSTCRLGPCRRNGCCLGGAQDANDLPCLSNLTAAQRHTYEMLMSELRFAMTSPRDWLMSTLFMTDEKLPLFGPVVDALCIQENTKTQRDFRRIAGQHLQSRLARTAPPALSSSR
jgi:hypothetical protein